MTRLEFIEQIWKRYPAWKAMGDSWKWGRICEFGPQKCSIICNGVRSECQFELRDFNEDPYWGVPIRPELLRLGDVVLISQDRRVFLLSPNVSNLPNLAHKKVELWGPFCSEIHSYFKAQGFLQARDTLPCGVSWCGCSYRTFAGQGCPEWKGMVLANQSRNPFKKIALQWV